MKKCPKCHNKAITLEYLPKGHIVGSGFDSNQADKIDSFCQEKTDKRKSTFAHIEPIISGYIETNIKFLIQDILVYRCECCGYKVAKKTKDAK